MQMKQFYQILINFFLRVQNPDFGEAQKKLIRICKLLIVAEERHERIYLHNRKTQHQLYQNSLNSAPRTLCM